MQTMKAQTIELPKRIKVRSSAPHMPTRALRDRSKYTRKSKHRNREF